LIISISGAGLYIIFETLKFIKEHEISSSYLLLQTAGSFLTLAIIVNFLSQFFGYNANNNETLYANRKIKQLMEENIDEEELRKYDCDSTMYTKLVRATNAASTICMFIGIILISVFFM